MVYQKFVKFEKDEADETSILRFFRLDAIITDSVDSLVQFIRETEQIIAEEKQRVCSSDVVLSSNIPDEIRNIYERGGRIPQESSNASKIFFQ